MAGAPLYFDHAATTPLDPRVLEAMLPWLGERFGNASSLHRRGREARAAVEAARGEIAALLGARPSEVIFTASGTEADNLALKGVMAAGGHLVTSAIEHPAILETCAALERRGVAVTYVRPTADGIVEPVAVAMALRGDTRLVSVMAANNVVGTLQPISEIATVAHGGGALFHTDAVQAVGKVPLDVHRLGIDLLSLSAHKLYGPQGVGALVVREGTALTPLLHGGGQERRLRPATENVAGLVGTGCAAALAASGMRDEAVRLVGLREHALAGIEERIPSTYLIGDRYRRLPGHLCLGFAGLEGEAIKLLLALDELDVAVSSGSACSGRHAGEPSHVLQAIGFDPIRARGSLRVTLGRFTTGAEVDRLIELLPPAVASLRPLTSRAF